MAVTFTANIGLAKPTEDELATEWLEGAELYEDNNLIIIDRTNIELQTYTPTINAGTTAPNIGAGSASGEYIDVLGFVIGRFKVAFEDPGVAVGLGEYGISLPFRPHNTFHTVGTTFASSPGVNSVIGEANLFDSSAVATSGAAALDLIDVGGVGYVRMVTEVYTAPAKTSRLFTETVPFPVATGDRITGSFCFRKAP